MARLDLIVLIKGAGEVGSAVAHRLHRSGFRVCLTELPRPLAINRGVAFSEAVYDGEKEVEGVVARRVESPEEAFTAWREGKLALFVDPEAKIRGALGPHVVVDARMAKRNLGTVLSEAPLVIGLGPGFRAGADVHVVVETNHTDSLGRLILSGEADKDTGIPTVRGGHTFARVLRAPRDGTLRDTKEIGTAVSPGDVVGFVEDSPVRAEVGGLLRGLLRSGHHVRSGDKLGEIDPLGRSEDCYRIRSHPRAVAGAVLEAVLMFYNKG